KATARKAAANAYKVASAAQGSNPGLCPSFAVVCSFLERYGQALDLPELTFPQMERYLRDTSTGGKGEEEGLSILITDLLASWVVRREPVQLAGWGVPHTHCDMCLGITG
uniref:Uncharacterized protein n=1 Tax=Oncorhynchus kisutch TaxID=8019 RepID=A0A8C7GI27_ONCKI